MYVCTHLENMLLLTGKNTSATHGPLLACLRMKLPGLSRRLTYSVASMCLESLLLKL